MLATIGLSALLFASPGVNAQIGDKSWVARYGELPEPWTPETDRIRVHLAYIEAMLRRAPDPVNPVTRARRRAALNHLARYRWAGRFPRRQAEDGYQGRRPRFIDHEGVHCAVGSLIAASGARALAHRIADRFEYAYVPEMNLPDLHRWAQEHGFTLRELAAIQPAYSVPPSRKGLRHLLKLRADDYTIACAPSNRVPRRLKLMVRVKRDGEVVATPDRPTAFGRCFASKVSTAGRGAYDPSPRAFEMDINLRLRRPQTILRKRVEAMRLDPRSTRCAPRPGAIVDEASFDISVGDNGVVVEVATRPQNEEVQECYTKLIKTALIDFQPGSWRISARTTRALPRVLDRPYLEEQTARFVTEHGSTCLKSESSPLDVEVSVAAGVDSQDFRVEVAGGDEQENRCLAEAIKGGLRSNVEILLEKPGGGYGSYFRIDADVLVPSMTLTILSKRDKARLDEERRRNSNEDRYEF